VAAPSRFADRYWYAVGRHYWWLVGVVLAGVVPAVLTTVFKVDIDLPWWVWLVLAVALLFVAQYLAWRDLRGERFAPASVGWDLDPYHDHLFRIRFWNTCPRPLDLEVEVTDVEGYDPSFGFEGHLFLGWRHPGGVRRARLGARAPEGKPTYTDLVDVAELPSADRDEPVQVDRLESYGDFYPYVAFRGHSDEPNGKRPSYAARVPDVRAVADLLEREMNATIVVWEAPAMDAVAGLRVRFYWVDGPERIEPRMDLV
jgi:hypothetical protein